MRGQKVQFTVATQCLTYNHAAFVKDTLNGFVSQQVSFPVVYVIVDDASTDGAPELLKKWADENLVRSESSILGEKMPYGKLYFSLHKSNPNAFFAILLLAENHYQTGKDSLKKEYIDEWCNQAKYIAFCEGDDYWVDPLKLQKQVDILDNNPDSQLCYSGFDTVTIDGRINTRKVYDYFLGISQRGNNLYRLFEHNYIMTLTVCVRNDCFYWDVYRQCPFNYDYNLALSSALRGPFEYLPEHTGCYRNNPDSLSNTKNSVVEKGLIEIFNYYASYYLNNGSYDKSWLVNIKIRALLFCKFIFRGHIKKALTVFSWNLIKDLFIILFIVYEGVINKTLFRIKMRQMD